MTRVVCPICKLPPSRHSKSKLIEHAVDCNTFVTYVKYMNEGKN